MLVVAPLIEIHGPRRADVVDVVAFELERDLFEVVVVPVAAVTVMLNCCDCCCC